MKKPNRNKKDNPERGRKVGEKRQKRAKKVKDKLVRRKQTALKMKIQKEEKFQEYMDKLIGK